MVPLRLETGCHVNPLPPQGEPHDYLRPGLTRHRHRSRTRARSLGAGQRKPRHRLFGIGLLLGLALGPVLSACANVDPAALWQAAGATAASVAALGALGYAVRRDLSSWARTLLWALVALIVFGIVAIFASIPHANVIYAVAGLAIFGAFTVFDFNRLRRTGVQDAIPLAASIFLDIFNVFLLFLQLFGGERD